MEERSEALRDLKKHVSECEARLKKLTGQTKGDEVAEELGALKQELKACRLEVDELEGKSGDEWLDAKYAVTRRLDDFVRNLQLSQDRLEDLIR